MDHKTLQNQLKNAKVRQGALYKRSKFLKQWRQRWIVLTTNYLFTFTNKTCKQVTDIIDLKEVKSYKSYVRKDDEMIPAGFKIRSDDNQYYFCGKNNSQKWSWLVTFERLMDYKFAGSSTYNNIDFIKTRGFPSQAEYQNGGRIEKGSEPQYKQDIKKKTEEAKKDVDGEVEKIMKELEAQKNLLKLKEQEVNEKEKFLKNLQNQLKMHQQQKLKQIIKKAQQSPKKQSNEIDHHQTYMPQSSTQQSPQKIQSPIRNTTLPSSNKVSELKSMYQQRIVEAQNVKQSQPAYKLGLNTENKQIQKSKFDELYGCRSKTVNNLFQEFHNERPEPQALRVTLQFLVKMASEQKYGYNSSILAEVKTHRNRDILAQIFVQMITDYKDFQNCDILAKFIQMCLHNAQGFFTRQHIPILQNKLIQFFIAIQDQKKIQTLLKTIFIINKRNKSQKNETVKNKLNKIIKEGKNEQNKNQARRLVDQF